MIPVCARCGSSPEGRGQPSRSGAADGSIPSASAIRRRTQRAAAQVAGRPRGRASQSAATGGIAGKPSDNPISPSRKRLTATAAVAKGQSRISSLHETRAAGAGFESDPVPDIPFPRKYHHRLAFEFGDGGEIADDHRPVRIFPWLSPARRRQGLQRPCGTHAAVTLTFVKAGQGLQPQDAGEDDDLRLAETPPARKEQPHDRPKAPVR